MAAYLWLDAATLATSVRCATSRARLRAHPIGPTNSMGPASPNATCHLDAFDIGRPGKPKRCPPLDSMRGARSSDRDEALRGRVRLEGMRAPLLGLLFSRTGHRCRRYDALRSLRCHVLPVRVQSAVERERGQKEGAWCVGLPSPQRSRALAPRIRPEDD